MSNSEEYVEDPECPCYKCITLGICKNKELQALMKDCSILYNYLYKGCDSNPKTMCLDIINLYQLCEIMGIEIERRDGSYTIKYRWQQ